MDPCFRYGETETAYLAAHDRRLGAAIARIGPISRRVNPDLFAALLEAIVDQQISLAAARTVRGRMLELLGAFTPETVAACPPEALQRCGITFRKAGYLKSAAQAVLESRLDIGSLSALPDEQAVKELMKLPGVGRWTAEMLLLFSLQRPDVVSYGDLAIRRGMMRLYCHRELPPERFRRYCRRYSPYGSTASLYLWAIAGMASWRG